jgi:HSP20 family molecular chaperone IbpA
VSEDAYFLDGEFPGVENKEMINLEVMEPRTLVVTAHVSRVDLRKEWGSVPVTAGGSHQADTATPRPPQRTQTSSSMSEKPVGEAESHRREREQSPPPPIYPGPPVEPVIWVGERQVGHLQRSFTFPSDVDMSSLSARFKDGLLKIMVRKVVATESKNRKKLNIED